MVPWVAVSLQNKMSVDQLKALEGVEDVVLQRVALLQSSSSVGWKAPHCPRQRRSPRILLLHLLVAPWPAPSPPSSLG